MRGRKSIDYWSWWLGVVMTATLAGTPTWAQVVLPPIFDPTGKSGEPPAPLKKEFKPPTPPPRPALPTVPQPPEEDVQKRFPKVRVFVHDIHVTGSTVFSDAEIDGVVAPFRNRTLTTEDLERLRLALTLLYVNKGYITSGAVIPDQDVTFGVITVQIVEGSLARIDVEGADWFRPSYLQKRVAMGAQTPLNVAPLQERLQLLQQDQRIERINAELRPGATRGESVLNLKVKEASPFKAWLEFNNFQTPVVGAERGLATVAHQNVTGNGDTFSFTYGRSRGVNPIIDTTYALPLNRYDTTFSAYYRRNIFLVVEAPFQDLNVKTDAEIIGLSLRQPLYRTLSDEFAVSIIGEHVFNKTFIFNEVPFDFFPGSKNGVANVSALRFAQEYTHRTSNAVIAARSRFSIGLDVLDATINPSNATNQQGATLATGRYFAWLGQVQAVRRFDEWWGIQLLGRMDLQVANNHLFPLEQFPVGGRFSVRGYRENSLVRDNAFTASVETRIPLWRFASGEDRLQFAPFVDVGRSWNAKGGTTDPETLASVGAGLRWMVLPQDRARFEVYWGQQLNHFRTGEGNLQDHGVHLQMVVQVL